MFPYMSYWCVRRRRVEVRLNLRVRVCVCGGGGGGGEVVLWRIKTFCSSETGV